MSTKLPSKISCMHIRQSVNLLLSLWIVQGGLASSLALRKSGVNTKLRPVAADTVRGVEVLDDEHLEAGGAALSRGNDGPGEEEFPDLRKMSVSKGTNKRRLISRSTYSVPALTVLVLNLLAIADPVAVPSPKSSRVVNADSVNAMNALANGVKYESKDSRDGARTHLLTSNPARSNERT